MAKQLPLQAQRPVSIKDAKGPTLSQTDTPARPSAEHSAHAVGHAHCKATRIKASVDDLPQRSGNGAQRIFGVGVIQALTAGAIPQ